MGGLTGQYTDNDDVQLKGGTDQTLIGNSGDKLKVDGSGVTQPVSGTITVTGVATAANQSTEITALQILDDVPTAQNGALSKGTPIMGQLDDTSTTAATEDNVAAIRITAQRAAHTNLRNIAGTEIATSANPLRVDPTGTTTQPISDAGGSITVDGTVAATQSGTWSNRITDGTDTALVTTNGEQKVVDGLRNGGVYGALSIPTLNVPVEAKVGVSRLTNRKFLQIYSNNNGLFWGLDNTVTTTSGVPLVNGQVVTFAIDPDSTFQVWLVGSTNSKSAQIVECT